jgi:hypothetical protein
MASTVHKIARYSVQVLNQKAGIRRGSIIIHLYNDKDENCGIALFQDYHDDMGEYPEADTKGGRVSAHYDISFFQPFIEILRTEDELYWKYHLVQMGRNQEVTDVSLDTKKEIIGEFFTRSSG